jgi:hypothetical protein
MRGLVSDASGSRDPLILEARIRRRMRSVRFVAWVENYGASTDT